MLGKLFGDKRYTSKELIKNVFWRCIHLNKSICIITKNSLIDMYNKTNLRKRSVTETIYDELKE